MANDRSLKRQQSEQTVHQLFSWSHGIWNMVRFAPRYAGRCSATPSQHGILGVKAPLLASAACKVAPHVVLVLVASPGLQDLVLIDRERSSPKAMAPS